MQYVGKVFSTVSQLYKELNPATLSGAIDVVVVEGKDGELACSPFHVRFGKLQLLRPSDKAVQIIVNDKPADFYMKVSDSGEAFFVLETESDVPSQYATSPVASPTLSFKQDGLSDPDFLDLSGNVRIADAHANDGYVSAPSAHETDSDSNSNDDDEDLLHRLGDGPLIAGRPRSSTLSAATTESAFVYSQNKETEHRSNNVVPAQRPMSVVSDSEFITKDNTAERKTAADWDWGVKLESVQPHHQHRQLRRSPPSSSSSSSLSSLHKMPSARLLPERLELSLCGIEPLQHQTAEDTDEKKTIFDNARVHESMFHSDPSGIIANKDLVFRTNDGMYIEGGAMLATLVSQLAFGGPGPSTSNGYEDGGDSKEPEDGKPVQNQNQKQNQQQQSQQQSQQQQQQRASAQRRWWRWGGSNVNVNGSANGNGNGNDIGSGAQDAISDAEKQPSPVDDMLGYMSDDGLISHPVRTEHGHEHEHEHEREQRLASNMHYAKTLRLTSDQLKSLGLRRGANDVKFLVASNNAYCEARIFMYQYDTQIVISDIDGTITKSDALGHLFNMVGKDWTHMGVAKLYSDIVSNGYEIIYLTARAIGQADGTRYFLSNVKQSNYKLPLGPLLLSPDRLFTSFHREVIKRRPHEFKMACLRDIKNLFGGYSPFYAGFGNRITDAMSYRSVNVPVSRICTIDTTGEIKLDLLPGYRSSYVKMNDLVDMMFPALSTKLDPTFNDWEYWKAGLPSIEDELAAIDIVVHPVTIKSTENTEMLQTIQTLQSDPGYDEDEEGDEDEDEDDFEEEEDVDPDMLAIMHDMEQVQHE
ncbi:lipin Ned1 [Coemansia sp. RSA 1813]|nr:lipin Ned1 [Coemansia sp. RSA 1813]